MIVCVCKGVSDREIRRAMDAGVLSVSALARQCGAGTECGSCCPALQDMLRDDGDRARGTQGMPAPAHA